jgi:hypothetical protein
MNCFRTHLVARTPGFARIFHRTITPLHVALWMGAPLLLLLSAPPAAADTIAVTGSPTGTGCTVSGSGPEMSATCTGPGAQSANWSGSASIGTLAASASATDWSASVEPFYIQNVTFGGLGTVTCPSNPGVNNCPAGNVETFPGGTSLTGVMVWALDGTWAYSGTSYAEIDPDFELLVNGASIVPHSTGNPFDRSFD